VEPDGLVMPFCVLAAGCSPRGEILELAERVQVPRHSFARGLLQSDLFKSCSTGVELQSEIREMIALLLDQICGKPHPSVRGKPYTSVN